MSALILLPNNPFVAAAAAQAMGAAESAARSGVAAAAAPAAMAATAAGSLRTIAPLSPGAALQAFGAPLSAAADGPRPALAPSPLVPSPWNPGKPTALLVPAAERPAEIAALAAQASGLSGLSGSGLSGHVPGAPTRGPTDASGRDAAVSAERPAENGGSDGLFDGAKSHDPYVSPALQSQAVPTQEEDLGWKDLPPVPAGAPSSLADVSLEPAAGARYTASPKHWEKEIVYSVILDRFAKAEPSESWGDPAAATTRHGGNIRGLTEKLDYLRGMGVTTLLVNPLYFTLPAAYHNYWPLHFMAVDPHLGTMADFQNMVAEAHKRGMRVVLDMVFNHTGPIMEYKEGYKFSHEPKHVKDWKYPLKPAELAQEDNFHRRGSIDDWNNEEQVRYGDFPGGLNHLATDRPQTQDMLLKIAKWWLKETDVDGYRLDTYMHVAPSFWTRFFQDMREYAGKLGKDNFLILGEIYHGDPKVLAPELVAGRLGAAFNYPAYFKDNDALHGEGPTRLLEDGFRFVSATLGDALRRLVRFVDNQDKPRFLRPSDPVALLRVALAYTLMSVGIPFVYYGTEQAFRPVQRPTDLGLDAYRQDMFPGQFKSAGSQGDDFKADSPMYQHLRALAAARAAHPALSLGEQFIRWSDPAGPGIFAFSRIYDGEEVLVVLNTAGEARSAEMWVDASLSPAGTELVDELAPGYKTAVHSPAEGGSKVSVDIPPYGVRLLVRRAAPR